MNKKAFITSWYVDFWAYLITFFLLALFFIIFIPLAQEPQNLLVQHNKIELDTALLVQQAYTTTTIPTPNKPTATLLFQSSFPTCIPTLELFPTPQPLNQNLDDPLAITTALQGTPFGHEAYRGKIILSDLNIPSYEGRQNTLRLTVRCPT